MPIEYHTSTPFWSQLENAKYRDICLFKNAWVGDLFNHPRTSGCFMKTDRIFVLLLIVMLPMSGCFGDGVGDAEAADYNDEGTTVIHYNNTTIVRLSFFFINNK